MNNKSLIIVLLLVLGGIHQLSAQRIVFSDPEREDSKRTNFEIIGKLNDNFLVLKNNRADNAISVYDESMRLKKRVPQKYMPDRVINVDLIAYKDYAYMIYQYQRKNIVYCEGVTIDAEGRNVGDPVVLDTTQVGFSSDNKLYSTLVSEDKKRVMLLKINSRNNRNFIFTTVLLDERLKQLEKTQIHMPMQQKNDYFTDFSLANNGELIFGKFLRSGGNDNISALMMVSKMPGSDSFDIKEIDLQGVFLDEIKLRIDNLNKQILLNAFLYRQKRGNIEGIYSAIFDQEKDSLVRSNAIDFDEKLREAAKGEANIKSAFNDYFIKTIIPKVDGGYVLTAESNYTSSRGYNWNRWDYLSYGNPWMMSSDYYFWNRYYSPWGWNSYRNNNNYNTRYHADNIMVISFNNQGAIEWSNVIPKTQYDDESDFKISFAYLLSGGQIKFLFNEYQRRSLLLSEQSIDPEGKITRAPTLKSLDKGYEFLPKYARQVSARQLIIPSFYRNYLCFALVEY